MNPITRFRGGCGLAVVVVFVAIALRIVAASAAPAIPEVKITALAPENPSRIAAQQALNVRLAYESAQPLRFQAHAYRAGRKVESFMMNGAPAYPAGRGEALAWVASGAGARLDELRVTVYDVRWHELTEVSREIDAEWHAGIAAAPMPSWVAELATQQDELIKSRANEPPPTKGQRLGGVFAGLLTFVALASVIGYPIVQILACAKLKGVARLLSCLPLSFMVPVYAYTVYALTQGSNLWPLLAIFASPVALLITTGVWAVVRKRIHHEECQEH